MFNSALFNLMILFATMFACNRFIRIFIRIIRFVLSYLICILFLDFCFVVCKAVSPKFLCFKRLDFSIKLENNSSNLIELEPFTQIDCVIVVIKVL